MEFGTLIAKNELLGDTELTLAVLADDGIPVAVNISHKNQTTEEDKTIFQAALVGIPDTAASYQMELAGRAYMIVTYADGSSATFYTAFDANENIRSMYQAAKELVENGEEDDVLNTIINTVEG